MSVERNLRRTSRRLTAGGSALILGATFLLAGGPAAAALPGWSAGVQSWATDLNTGQRLSAEPEIRWRRGRHPAVDDRRRPVAALPDDDRLRGVDDGLVGVRPQPVAGEGPEEDHRPSSSPRPTGSGCRCCASRWVPRTSRWTRRTHTTTSLPARRTRRCPTSRSRTIGPTSCLGCARRTH